MDHQLVDHDVVIVWSQERRIITGSDLLGRLQPAVEAGRAPAVEGELEPVAAVEGRS